MTKSREKEREILLTSVLKIGLWENRPITGTKAWENIHIRNKGVRDFPYREQRLGNALLISKGWASRQDIPYKGWWNLLEVPIVLPDHTSYYTTTSQHLFIIQMSSSTCCQQNARHRATELARPNSPLIFNQEHYSVCIVINWVIDKLTKNSLPV